MDVAKQSSEAWKPGMRAQSSTPVPSSWEIFDALSVARWRTIRRGTGSVSNIQMRQEHNDLDSFPEQEQSCLHRLWTRCSGTRPAKKKKNEAEAAETLDQSACLQSFYGQYNGNKASTGGKAERRVSDCLPNAAGWRDWLACSAWTDAATPLQGKGYTRQAVLFCTSDSSRENG